MDDQRKAIEAELVALRKNKSPSSSLSMASTPVLVELLGQGDVLLARNELLNYLRGLAGDREVFAFALTFLGKGSVLDRLQVTADTMMFEDVRQARRLSDAGIEKLAAFIAGRNPTYKPIRRVRISGSARSRLRIEVSYHSLLEPKWGEFKVNGKKWTPQIDKIESDEYAPEWRVETCDLPGNAEASYYVSELSSATWMVDNLWAVKPHAVRIRANPTELGIDLLAI